MIISYVKVLDDKENSCYDQTGNFPSPLEDNQQNKFYATKTLYSTAYNHLTKSTSQLLTNIYHLSANNDNPSAPTAQLDNYNRRDNSQPKIPQQPQANGKSSIHIPKMFSKKNSLESMNEHLLEERCKPIQFHFYGRHAARLPKDTEIESINGNIKKIQDMIDQVIKKLLDEEKLAKSIGQDSESSLISSPQEDNDLPRSENKTVAGKNCSDPRLALLQRLKQWQPFAIPQQGNLITESGAHEARQMAERFRKVFPQFFDDTLTNISVSVTQELRTAQTALEFAKAFASFRELNSVCTLDKFPETNTYDPTESAKVMNDDCFKRFTSKFKDGRLEFHKRCDGLSQQRFQQRYGFDLKEGYRTQFIADAVSKRLALEKLSAQTKLESGVPSQIPVTTSLTPEQTHSIYEACRYESVARGRSDWCKLFHDDEINFYEYLIDIDDFYNEAYGSNPLRQSSCEVLTPLATKLTLADLSIFNPQKGIRQESNFFFTHSAAIQRIIAAIHDLKDDPAYHNATVLGNLKNRKVPQDRNWRTSLMTPFSANLAFVLYQCPNATVGSEVSMARENEENDQDVNVGLSSPLKIVTLLNEHPIIVDQCNDYACDLPRLLRRGIFPLACDMSSICAQHLSYT